MADKNDLFQFQQTFSVRLTASDMELVNGNAEQLYGEIGVQLNPRTAFLAIVEKALSRKQIVKDQTDQAKINELTSQLKEWIEIQKQFEDYMIIAKHEGLAENYQQMFARWLNCIQHGKKEAWTLDENDKQYLKNYRDERNRG